jgi:hypothetical protein
MKKLYMLPLLAVMAGAGCQQPTHTTSTNDTLVSAAADTSHQEAAPEATQERPPTPNIVMELRQHADSIRQALPSATPEQAAKMYHIFADAALLAIQDLSANESKWLDTYINSWSEEAQDYRPDEATQARVRLLAQAGIEPYSVGEGYTELQLKPNFYQNLFGQQYLPADYQTYVNINAHEDSSLFQADAGIIVPWSEAARRVQDWDNFCTKYPGSKLIEQAQKNYTYYMDCFLLGEDNTRTVEDGQLVQEVKEAFEQYVAEYPNTRGGKLVAEFLQLLTETKDRDRLNAWVRERLGIM